MINPKFPAVISFAKTWGIASLLFMLLASSCSAHGRDKDEKAVATLPSRQDLIQVYREKDQLIFVYGTGDTAAARAYQTILQPFTKNTKYKKIIVKSDQELTEAEMQNFPVFLLGMPENNSMLQKLLPKLPFNVTPQTVEFNQHQYGDHPILSIRLFPNPAANAMPLSLLTGISEADIIAHLEEQVKNPYYLYSISGWGYQMNDGGQRKVMGFFDEADPKQWKIGGNAHWDFGTPPELRVSNDQVQLFSPPGKFKIFDVEQIADQQTKDWGAIFEVFPPKSDLPQVSIQLYESAEMKGLQTGNSKPTSISADGKTLEMVVHPAWKHNEQAEGNLIAIRHSLGKPAIQLLEDGLAIRFTRRWQNMSWQHWLWVLCQARQDPTVIDLLDPEIYKYESPIYLGCFAAGFSDFLLEEYGKETFVNIYQGQPGYQKKLKGLEAKWKAYLTKTAMSNPTIIGTTKAGWDSYMEQTQRYSKPLKMLKGFNFAHEGYQIFNGYLGKEATRSLNYLQKEMHSNATAIIPYTGMGDVNAPNWFRMEHGAGSENDESVVNCIWSAHQAGMQVMIKPQVWPWNGWTGEVEMKTEADWQLFFDRYYRWIRHYALLAEIEQAEMLCIGVEFSKASLQRPDDWRKMIAKLRGIYHGKITYAANWGQEFEQLEFWDALDFIGLNCYYPLSKSDKLDQKEIEQGFAKTMDKVGKIAEKHGKPVVFTEIGFRSCEGAFQNPHAEADGRPASDETQADCYKAMIKGLENRHWFKGILLWKWPAYMDDAKYDPIGFTPLGKPAADLTKDWFKTLKD